MALVKCPKCNRDITSTSEKCGYCGHQIKPFSLIETEEDDIRAQRVVRASIILLISIVLTVIIVFIVRSHNRTIMREEITTEIEKEKKLVQPKANPDTLLAKAKSFYKIGKYNDADIILSQIMYYYKDSEASIEASKLRVIVVKAIQDGWNEEQKKRSLAKERAERKRRQELSRLCANDPIKYYKTIYGNPDNEEDYAYGTYRSKTLTWFCVKVKYRSITFNYNYSKWTEESEYTSNCI